MSMSYSFIINTCDQLIAIFREYRFLAQVKRQRAVEQSRVMLHIVCRYTCDDKYARSNIQRMHSQKILELTCNVATGISSNRRYHRQNGCLPTTADRTFKCELSKQHA